MNNLTADNMPQKGKELANVVLPKYVEWFANYLVVRRAAQVGGAHSISRGRCGAYRQAGLAAVVWGRERVPGFV